MLEKVALVLENRKSTSLPCESRGMRSQDSAMISILVHSFCSQPQPGFGIFERSGDRIVKRCMSSPFVASAGGNVKARESIWKTLRVKMNESEQIAANESVF